MEVSFAWWTSGVLAADIAALSVAPRSADSSTMATKITVQRSCTESLKKSDIRGVVKGGLTV